MNFNFSDIIEHIRIKSGKMNIKILTAFGKDGDSFVIVSPTLLVSGYGNTEKEAQESFEHNLEVFCKDILDLNSNTRDNYLHSLGFAKEKFKTKNFSKLYVDENGVLQGLDPHTIKTSILEAVA